MKDGGSEKVVLGSTEIEDVRLPASSRCRREIGFVIVSLSESSEITGEMDVSYLNHDLGGRVLIVVQLSRFVVSE